MGLGSVIGIILGIVALVKLSKAGAASGKGLAIAGLVVSGVGLLLLPALLGIGAAILMPTVMNARGHANQAAFMNNLRQLFTATMVYTTEQDGRLPPAEPWMDELESQGMLSNVDMMTRAPGDPDAGRAVAMNAAIGGLPVGAVRMPSRTVLFFECASGSPPAGGPDLLPPEPRYPDGYIVAFADGHVESVRPEDTGDLVWEPGQP